MCKPISGQDRVRISLIGYKYGSNLFCDCFCVIFRTRQTDTVIEQKINYIHNNPVQSGFVTDPVDWKYSSARNYQDDHGVPEIDSEGYNLGLAKL